MGWFSPIKGHYPSLGQIDKTLPVKVGATTIERGMIIFSNENGEFEVATGNSDPGLCYIALQDYRDAQAGMAGTTGFDADVGPISEGNISIDAVTAGVPAITGLSLSMDGEYETDMIAESHGFTVLNDMVGVTTGGRLAKVTDASKAIGYLTAKPYDRWVNNAGAKPANTSSRDCVRQGAMRTVIRFRTK